MREAATRTATASPEPFDDLAADLLLAPLAEGTDGGVYLLSLLLLLAAPPVSSPSTAWWA
jgi:hypothetical protein